MRIQWIEIYEIALSLKEAKFLAKNGFGYESDAEAKKALASPEIDSFYRNRLKVFKVKIPRNQKLKEG